MPGTGLCAKSPMGSRRSAGGFDQFGNVGQELAGDGIVGIGGIHQRRNRGRNRHGVFLGDQRQCHARFLAKLGRNTVKSPITGRKEQTL